MAAYDAMTPASVGVRPRDGPSGDRGLGHPQDLRRHAGGRRRRPCRWSQGELVALLGPSGSGKTTLLRVIAGLEVPDAGIVAINGRHVVAATAPGSSPSGGGSAWCSRTARCSRTSRWPTTSRFGEPAPGRVEECLELVGLADRARSYPHELSGGERQRVALARALAPDPDVVLLDEPFASLDAGLRVSLREEVAGILRRAGRQRAARDPRPAGGAVARRRGRA